MSDTILLLTELSKTYKNIQAFPAWGAALAMTTLGYYYRQHGPCSVCGRGITGEIGKPSSSD